jgi:hypothetical protein
MHAPVYWGGVSGLLEDVALMDFVFVEVRC